MSFAFPFPSFVRRGEGEVELLVGSPLPLLASPYKGEGMIEKALYMAATHCSIDQCVNIYNSRPPVCHSRESGNPESFSLRRKRKAKTLDPRQKLSRMTEGVVHV